MLIPIQIRIGNRWHQHDADPKADPTPSITHVGKSYFFTISHSFSSLQYFIFLISVKDDSIDTDLDRPDPDWPDPNLDPTK
jgi:hypothetical protein